MARNVGKTHLEENLAKSMNRHQGKLLLGLGLVVLALLLFSSRDYFSEYGGVVETIGMQERHFTVHKRAQRKMSVMCATLRHDGESESTEVCNEDPRVFEQIKPRHRFVKPRFQRYMRAVGEEVPIPWLKTDATGAGAGSATPGGGSAAPGGR